MPITVSRSKISVAGTVRIEVRQSIVRPVIYLDHWALMRLADEADLGDLFLATFARSAGTLLVSWLTFTEFCKLDDPRHGHAAVVFLDRIFPNIYFTSADMDVAMASERDSSNHPDLEPPGDKGLLDEIARAYGHPPFQYSFARMFYEIHKKRSDLEVTFDAFRAAVAARVEEQSALIEMKNKAKAFRPSQQTVRTQTLMGELLRTFMLDQRLEFKPNDSADLIHALIASSYCDYLLLDRAWHGRLLEAKRRLRKHGADIPVAKSYSAAAGQLEKFLADLTAFTASAGGGGRSI